MYPIILLSVSGLITLFLGFSKNKAILLPATLLFLISAFLIGLLDWNKPGQYFNGMLEITNLGIVIQSIILLSAIFIVALSSKQFDDAYAHPAELFAIIQLSLVGALMMVTYQNFIMLFLGLEILSVALYVLTGSDKRNLRGNEAAIKYFLMGAFATGILLFGIAMLYGGTGSFAITGTATMIKMYPEAKIFYWIGMIMILVGLLFKVSAAPFHFWTADVYQGAPTIFTAFMATIVKTSGFFALYRIVSISFGNDYSIWSNILIGSIALSLVIGNVSAVFQSSFKRMLAFSSISQAGFMLLSLIGLSTMSASSLGFYSLSYALATVTAFGVFMVVSANQLENGRPNENIEVFKGLYKREPMLAVALVISMLSLSGIPLTSGFWGKFFVFNDAASKGFVWIIVLAVVMSTVSLYYYFKPIRATFDETDATLAPIEVPLLTKMVLIVCCLLIVLLGIAPQLLKGLI
jgi:NADH-quinone oxidoreductase subunit N